MAPPVSLAAGKCTRVRARRVRLALLTSLATALLVIIAWLVVEMPLDWLVELPPWARAAFLATGIGGAAAALWRFGIREWLHQPDDDCVALAIERALPQFRSRFISSVQLSRQHAGLSNYPVRAPLRETTVVAAEAPFAGVVKTDRLQRWTHMAGAALLLVGVLWWIGAAASWPVFQHALLARIPVPQKTMITAFTGDRVIAVGDDLRIAANVAGIIPKSGKVVIETTAESVGSWAMAIHRIEIVPDQPPTIRILLPSRREELVTRKATLLLVFEAKDDFGTAKVLLHFAVNWTDGPPHKTLELDLGAEQPTTMTRRFEWKLDRLTPPLGERAGIQQSLREKYPEEYGALVEQYLLILANESAKK